MNENDIELLQSKAQIFLETNTPAHIELFSKSFYNGSIVKVSTKHLIINDRILGCIPIMFADISILEENRRRIMNEQITKHNSLDAE